jgi:hypothetical protein
VCHRPDSRRVRNTERLADRCGTRYLAFGGSARSESAQVPTAEYQMPHRTSDVYLNFLSSAA